VSQGRVPLSQPKVRKILDTTLAGATERVGARDVEITQDYMAQPMGGGGVA